VMAKMMGVVSDPVDSSVSVSTGISG
jgi:hypothetical protein